ncbi:hypothetical protein [Kitasatospora sp. NPDC088134]|uniref:hypothetical protein n=1 Tax=Kitasatospora sp. NPDC088134 TaxID=3364071 RepID=UPI00382A3BE6
MPDSTSPRPGADSTPAQAPPRSARPFAVADLDMDVVREEFTALARRIADGKLAEQERSELMRILHAEGKGLTQSQIADLAAITQQAVSLAVRKVPAVDLDGSDAPWLVGRLLGIADRLVAAGSTRPAASELLAFRLSSGRTPFTPPSIAQLCALLERDLRRPGAPSAARTAYADVKGLLAAVELPDSLGRAPDAWNRLFRARARQSLALAESA